MQCLGRLYLHPCASLATYMHGHTTSQRRAKQVSLHMILGAMSKGQGVSTPLKKHSFIALHVTQAIRARSLSSSHSARLSYSPPQPLLVRGTCLIGKWPPSLSLCSGYDVVRVFGVLRVGSVGVLSHVILLACRWSKVSIRCTSTRTHRFSPRSRASCTGSSSSPSTSRTPRRTSPFHHLFLSLPLKKALTSRRRPSTLRRGWVSLLTRVPRVTNSKLYRS